MTCTAVNSTSPRKHSSSNARTAAPTTSTIAPAAAATTTTTTTTTTTAALLVLGLAASLGVQGVQAQAAPAPACLSLATSRSCPEFAAFSIAPDRNLFTTVAAFDTYVATTSGSNPLFLNFFRTQYSCPAWDGAGLRYAQSFVCGSVIDRSTAEFGCNARVPAGPTARPLCRATAAQTLDSYAAIFANTTACPPNPARALPASYRVYLNRLPATPPASGCVSGTVKDISYCGFDTAREVTAFCAIAANTASACCAAAQAAGHIIAATATTVAPAPSLTLDPAPVDNSASGSNSLGASPLATQSAAANSANASQESTTTSLRPILIGGIVAGAGILVAALFAAFFFRRRRSNAKAGGAVAGASSKAQQENIQVAETMEVIYDYTPNLFDEIELHVGDHVILKVSFDDGWAYGFNMVTKQEGSFPLACVAPISEGNGNGNRRGEPQDMMSRDSLPANYRQRASSLYIPNPNER